MKAMDKVELEIRYTDSAGEAHGMVAAIERGDAEDRTFYELAPWLMKSLAALIVQLQDEREADKSVIVTATNLDNLN